MADEISKPPGNLPHNTAIEITIKIDPAAIAGIAQSITRVASSTWRVAIGKTAIRIYLILLTIAAVAVIVALVASGVLAAHIVAKAIIALAVVGLIILKRRYSPLIP